MQQQKSISIESELELCITSIMYSCIDYPDIHTIHSFASIRSTAIWLSEWMSVCFVIIVVGVVQYK